MVLTELPVPKELLAIRVHKEHVVLLDLQELMVLRVHLVMKGQLVREVKLVQEELKEKMDFLDFRGKWVLLEDREREDQLGLWEFQGRKGR